MRGFFQAGPYCGKETEFAGITLRCTAEISGVVIKYEILIYYFFFFFLVLQKTVLCLMGSNLISLVCVCS